MERNDVAKLLAIVSSVYPNFRAENKTQTLDAWFFALGDFDYTDISEALKIYMRTSGSAFAPSVSELISMTNKTENLTRMNELEAWTQVRKALSRSTYYAEEEFEKLPDISKKVVGSAEQLRNWATTSIESIETVIASNFQRTYRAMVERETQINMLPQETRARLESIQRIALGGK